MDSELHELIKIALGNPSFSYSVSSDAIKMRLNAIKEFFEENSENKTFSNAN